MCVFVSYSTSVQSRLFSKSDVWVALCCSYILYFSEVCMYFFFRGTGTGKTLSYALPILERMSDENELRSARGRPPCTLVMVPTRELANQVSAYLDLYIPLTCTYNISARFVNSSKCCLPVVCRFSASMVVPVTNLRYVNSWVNTLILIYV